MFYFNIDISPKIDDHEAEHSCISLSTKVINIIHGININNTSNIALDFISTNNVIDIIRVFHPNKEILIDVKQRADNHWIVRDYAKTTIPARAPKTDKYAINKRYRVPRKGTSNREKRLDIGHNLLHFHLNSKSNNHSFILAVQSILVADNEGGFEPSSYGLSRADKLFTLPRF